MKRCAQVCAAVSLLQMILGWIPPLGAQSSKSLTGWSAGLARVAITPDKPIWMAGYASRNKPAEGKLQELYAKALALEDERDRRVVIITTDLLGFSRAIAEAIASRARTQFGLPRSQLVLTSSHTHTGPALAGSLVGAYDLNAEQTAAIDEYSRALEEKIVALIGRALADLAPAKLTFGRGEAGFGVNRREMTTGGMRIGVNKDGPADSDVPVLRIESPQGQLRGVLFGYACHNTTLTGEFYQWSGDYAGYAQAAIEKKHPGVTAMFVIGCGADINPYPRSKLELATQHGEALAQAVEKILGASFPQVRGPLRTAFDYVALPLSPPPTREEFQSRLGDQNPFRRRHAERMLARLERDRKLISEYSYPIQVIQFGDHLTFIALAGEVVVDYALRLRRELGLDGLWVAGYSNDVFAYIPSARMFSEGGYEVLDSMIYYDLPGPFVPAIEEKIIKKVHELARRAGRRPAVKTAPQVNTDEHR